MNEELLKEAIKKRETKNIVTDMDFDLSIEDFILKIYINCDPSKYGEAFQSYIKRNFFPKIRKISKDFNRGDLHIKYEKYFEVKISYLNMNGKYSITHIRDWQRFDYFILCFVDDNFNPSFYCVPKNVVTKNEKLILNAMNCTKDINLKNTRIGKRTSPKLKDTKFIFKEKSILKGTTYNDLQNFIHSL